MGKVVRDTNISGLKPFSIGKVRDIYDLDDSLLFVASDRISAFDVVLPTAIPYKGQVLTTLSTFWFDITSDIIGNHLITADFAKFPPELQKHKETLIGRSMIVKKSKANRYGVRRQGISIRERMAIIQGQRLRLWHKASIRASGIGQASQTNIYSNQQGRIGT